MDYLFASVEGAIWEYNPVSNKREPQVALSEEIVYGGMVENALFDFWSDTSYQKFLDDTHSLDEQYVPTDIVQISSSATFNDASKFQLREEAAGQFAEMASAFALAFGDKAKLSLTSTYRSPTYQKRLAENCSVARCAKAGTSEHEAGLAVDLGVNGGNILGNGGKYYQWFTENAHLYGFHNTYQKGVEIDGKMVEPRHWRYIGVDLATYLYESQRTIAEYFYLLYE
ncbi:MAG: D-alanyl-D-alanine carboxypeptidase family protein [Candidatus Peribacteria bacterium]|nr:D-alanyl-D-alanine carboxypeptidase family protein [Candidatus Peribacteria bacterium]